MSDYERKFYLTRYVIALSIAEFTLKLGISCQTGNSSNMYSVTDEFLVSTFSSNLPVQTERKVRDEKLVLHSHSDG